MNIGFNFARFDTFITVTSFGGFKQLTCNVLIRSIYKTEITIINYSRRHTNIKLCNLSHYSSVSLNIGNERFFPKTVYICFFFQTNQRGTISFTPMNVILVFDFGVQWFIFDGTEGRKHISSIK